MVEEETQFKAELSGKVDTQKTISNFTETMNHVFPEDTEVAIAIDGLIWRTKKLGTSTRVFVGFYPTKA